MRTKNSPKAANIGHTNSTPTDAAEPDCAKWHCREKRSSPKFDRAFVASRRIELCALLQIGASSGVYAAIENVFTYYYVPIADTLIVVLSS